jgi:drug/metabolite transporter (DMT)-like permease
VVLGRDAQPELDGQHEAAHVRRLPDAHRWQHPALLGIANGELSRWTWTLAGIGGMLYLTVFGSCLAYATYMWLINHTTPARLGTIAYVNPAIATGLGWWVLGESLTPLQLGGMAVILGSVAWVSISAREAGRR